MTKRINFIPLKFPLIIFKKLSVLLLLSTAFLFLGCGKKKNAEGTVHIKNSNGTYQLMRNGEPFYIKGASGNYYFDELAHAGANTIRLYDTVNLKQNLDRAHQLGLAVIVDIPIPQYVRGKSVYRDKNNRDAVYKKVQQLVENHKKHPALLIWNLGNELNYPLGLGGHHFIKFFNKLVAMVHETDPEHPVSTSVTAITKKEVISIRLNSPDLDILNFNVFGDLRNVEAELSKLSILGKNFPFIISEWGINGYWEEKHTAWFAPVEPTAAKKAELFKERSMYLKNYTGRCLGSLAFYWGQKQEKTHTWFGVFDEEGRKSESYYALEEIWKGHTASQKFASINYMLLNGKGALDNIMVTPGNISEATVYFKQNQENPITVEWEILPESWFTNRWRIQEKPCGLNSLIISSTKNSVLFNNPNQDGPYRIFVKIYNETEFTTTNTPFYVLGTTE